MLKGATTLSNDEKELFKFIPKEDGKNVVRVLRCSSSNSALQPNLEYAQFNLKSESDFVKSYFAPIDCMDEIKNIRGLNPILPLEKDKLAFETSKADYFGLRDGFCLTLVGGLVYDSDSNSFEMKRLFAIVGGGVKEVLNVFKEHE